MVQNMWHDVSAGKEAPHAINVILEIPKGSDVKYEMDKETGLIKLDRFLFSSIHYPGDYGFVPQTLWEDGDPLDIVVLTGRKLSPGVLAEVRPIAVLKMIDDGQSDDKVIAVYTGDPRYNEIKDLQDIPKHIIMELTHFFQTYKSLQGKETEIAGMLGKEEAIKSVEKGITLYKEKYGNKTN
ncbi:MAG: inorganic diphosphatase [Candidatus Woesearchaeota archaeon]